MPKPLTREESTFHDCPCEVRNCGRVIDSYGTVWPDRDTGWRVGDDVRKYE